MQFFKTKISLTTALIASVAAASSWANTIGLEYSIYAAIKNSPELLISKERRIQSDYGVDAEKSKLLPQVSFSSSLGRTYKDPASHKSADDPTGTGAFMNSSDMTFKVNQHIFDGFSTEAAIELAKLDQKKANFQLQVVKNDVLSQITSAYLEIHKNQSLAKEAHGFINKLKALEQKMITLAEEGKSSQTSQKYVSARVSKAQQSLVVIENALQNALEKYEFLTDIKLEKDVKTYIPEIAPLKQTEIFYKNMETYNPTFLLEKIKSESIEFDKQAALSEYYPKLSLVGEFNENHDIGGEAGRVRNASLMLNVKYNIYDGGNRYALKEQIESQLKEQDLKIYRTHKELKEEILKLWQSVNAKESEYTLILEEIENNISVRDARELEFNEGNGELITLMEEEENLYNSLTRKADIESTLLKNMFNLEILTGRLNLNNVFVKPYDDPTDITPTPLLGKAMMVAGKKVDFYSQPIQLDGVPYAEEIKEAVSAGEPHAEVHPDPWDIYYNKVETPTFEIAETEFDPSAPNGNPSPVFKKNSLKDLYFKKLAESKNQ